jgi:hypothetical protein
MALAFNTSCRSVTCYHLGSNPPRKDTTIVVVGAGVGGLATASRLASSFRKTVEKHPKSTKTRVIILEKNSEDWVGGRCGSFTVDVEPFGSFRHERGPSLLLLKDKYLDLFRDCTHGLKSAADYGLEIVQCIPAYQVCFDDGDYIHLGFTNGMGDNSLEIRSRKIMDQLEERGSSKWDEYMKITNSYLDCGLPNFVEEKLDLSSFPAFIYEVLRDGAKVRKSVQQTVSHATTNTFCFYHFSIGSKGMAIKSTLHSAG